MHHIYGSLAIIDIIPVHFIQEVNSSHHFANTSVSQNMFYFHFDYCNTGLIGWLAGPAVAHVNNHKELLTELTKILAAKNVTIFNVF